MMSTPTTATTTRRAGLCAGLVIVIASCSSSRSTEDQNRSAQQRRAKDAKIQLFETLSQRLKEVIESDGVAAAVSVCAGEAPAIATAVEQKTGIRIGRTSTRLRNQANTAPQWARSALAQPPAQATFIDLKDGALGALFPIRLKKMCESCHGDADKLAAPVRAALASHYPSDRATGYKEGDLRGWFWLEVPALPTRPAR